MFYKFANYLQVRFPVEQLFSRGVKSEIRWKTIKLEKQRVIN